MEDGAVRMHAMWQDLIRETGAAVQKAPAAMAGNATPSTPTEEREEDDTAKAEAIKAMACDICFGKYDFQFPHYKFCAKYSEAAKKKADEEAARKKADEEAAKKKADGALVCNATRHA